MLWYRIVSLIACLCAFTTVTVQAHPLGNFTINHLVVVHPQSGRLRLHYVLDIAEIPSFQIMRSDGDWTPARKRAWIQEEVARVPAGLAIRANGTALTLKLQRATATTRPGAGGLPTLYWTADYIAAVPPGRQRIAIVDDVYADRRIGWKDILLPGLVDPTNALRTYPSALVGSPRRNDRAWFDLRGDGRIAHVAVAGASARDWGVASMVRSSALSELFSRGNQTPLLVALTILTAFGLGALHGLEPGHGKALLAFTLVGARATLKQALILAGALTFAHTIAVLLLGLALFFAAGFASESIFSWITLLSGAAVAVIGARSLAASWHAMAPHGRNAHHEHAHVVPGNSPLRFGSAVVAAAGGGIAPCPAAIVVLLTALHLHRIGYGLLLIVVFSLGLASILAGLGLAVVHGAAWLQRRSSFAALTRVAPFITASVISLIGATMVAQGFVDRGVPLSPIAVAVLAIAAIIAYVLVPRYRHAGTQTARFQSTRSTS